MPDWKLLLVAALLEFVFKKTFKALGDLALPWFKRGRFWLLKRREERSHGQNNLPL